jgi:hypothetical protein
MKRKIAILGWGSLLWDQEGDFARWHDEWLFDGPEIKLEFSRISESRARALTLVIDPRAEMTTRVAYCISKRTSPEDAIADLRCREGTTLKNIGYVYRETENANHSDEESFEAIRRWSEKKVLDVVIWTALASNFKEKTGKQFSIPAAVSYLQTLDPIGKVKAAEYIWRAPAFVRTPLRQALEAPPWFSEP